MVHPCDRQPTVRDGRERVFLKADLHGARMPHVPDPTAVRGRPPSAGIAPTGGLAVSSRSAKHRKSKRAAPRQPASARHRKPSPISHALQNHPGKTAAAVTGAVVIAAAAPIATHWAGDVG